MVAQSHAEFLAEMETRFGTEKALGIYFRTSEGEVLTLAALDERAERIGKKIVGDSFFPHGGSGTMCTEFAIRIFMELPGRVKIFGFTNKANPSSRIAREQIHHAGHDFALVDDRYIVDPWPRLVPMTFQQMVFDMEDEADRKLVEDIYGPINNWSRSTDAESYARDLAKL